MAKITCAGMQLDGELAEGDSPLEAIVCIKVMSSDGHVDWEVMATRGLHVVEGIGAVRFAGLYLEASAVGPE
jgi:hypothetical protein